MFINEPVHECHINVPLRPVPGCRHLRMVVSFRKEERVTRWSHTGIVQPSALPGSAVTMVIDLQVTESIC